MNITAEMSTCNQFHQHYTVSFCSKFPFGKKITNRNWKSTEKLHKTLLYQKAAREMLVIWIPDHRNRVGRGRDVVVCRKYVRRMTNPRPRRRPQDSNRSHRPKAFNLFDLVYAFPVQNHLRCVATVVFNVRLLHAYAFTK